MRVDARVGGREGRGQGRAGIAPLAADAALEVVADGTASRTMPGATISAT